MSLCFIDEILNLLLTETVHQLASLGSDIRLRVCVENTLDIDLAEIPLAEGHRGRRSVFTTGVSYS